MISLARQILNQVFKPDFFYSKYNYQPKFKDYINIIKDYI